MASDVFDLFARLSIDTSQYESGLSRARGMAGKVGGVMSSGLNKAAKLTSAALAATSAAVTAFGKSAVQTGLSFDAAMGQVAATAGKTADELAETSGHVTTAYGEFNGTLRDFAKFMGKNTAFTATEAAQALNYMALAGYSTQQSMEMLPTVLDMAAAGSMDLARASDMITDTQSALGLSAERTALMVDEFAKAASTGNTSVEQLGEAFLTVGGLGKELNNGFIQLSDGTVQEIDNIEQLEIAFTAMANAGIKGSEAGTHMRNMLLKLANPTKGGTEALEKMGISVFDAEGKMRSLDNVFSDLSHSFEQMSQQEKLATIGELFNARDTASAEALLAAVEQDWDRIGESVLQAKGSATEMANTKLDNLQGQLTIMKSALEGAKITLSDKLVPSLKDLVKWGTTAIGKLTTAFEEGGVDGLMGAFGDLLSEGLNKGIEKLPNLTRLAGTLLSALGKGLLDNIDKVADAATQVLTEIAKLMITGLPGFLKVIGEIGKKIGTWLIENADLLLDGIETLIENIVDFVADNAGAFIGGIIKLVSKIVPRLPGILKTIIEALPTLLQNIVDAIVENAPMLVLAVADMLAMLAESLPDLIMTLIDALPDLLLTLFNALIDNFPILFNAVVDLITKLIEQAPTIILKIVEALPDMLEQIITGVLNNLPILIEGAVKVVTQLVAHLPEIIMGLIEAIPSILESIGEAFGPLSDILGTLFSGIVATIGGILGGLVTIASDIFGKVKDTITGIFDLIDAKQKEADAKERHAQTTQAIKDTENEKGLRLVHSADGNVSWWELADEEKYKAAYGGRDPLGLLKDKEPQKIDVGGEITIKGVNDKNEFVGAAHMTEQELAHMFQTQGRLY